MPSKNLILYAKWNKNSYTVTYKDGDAQSNGVDTVEYNSQVRVRPGLTKEGHIFKGWKSDADNTTYSPDQTFTMPAQNVTLTAQWTETDSPVVPSKLVKAKFFINLDGKDASNPYGKGDFTKGVEIKNAINLTIFDREKREDISTNKGYIFDINGVEKNLEYTGLLNQKPEDTAINNDINAKLPADKQGSMNIGPGTSREVVWYHVSLCSDGYHVDGYIKNVDITITYNPDGGTFADGTTNNKTERGLSGQAHTIIADIPTKSGYVFAGWKVEGDGSNKIYKNGESITPMSDLTLVAQWRVTLTYHENFGEKHTYTISVDKNSPQTVQSYAELRRLYGVFEKNTGFYFDEWNTQADGTGASHKVGSTIPMTGSIDLYAQWKQARVPKVAYTINQHFMDGEGKPSVANPDITTNKTTKNAQTTLDSLITDDLKKSKTGTDGKTYVYVPSETKFTLNDKAVTALVDGTEIHLYYYLDEVGGTPEKEGADRPDGIPDAWQHKVTFQVVNGNWNVSKNNKNIVVYVNAKNQAGEVLDSKLTASQIPAVGSEPNSGYEASGSWDKTLFDGLVINADTTFTFTYSKRSSSGGSSRPSTPTVTIPDDVPTGLNGKDHYAYIIGYGNNDVRPQNNITRAETMTLVNRVLNRLPETKDDLHKDMKTWVDNMDETAWYYLAVQEATNSHYFKNKTSTKFEQWTDLRDTRDWSELEK